MSHWLASPKHRRIGHTVRQAGQSFVPHVTQSVIGWGLPPGGGEGGQWSGLFSWGQFSREGAAVTMNNQQPSAREQVYQSGKSISARYQNTHPTPSLKWFPWTFIFHPSGQPQLTVLVLVVVFIEYSLFPRNFANHSSVSFHLILTTIPWGLLHDCSSFTMRSLSPKSLNNLPGHIACKKMSDSNVGLCDSRGSAFNQCITLPTSHNLMYLIRY